MPRDHLPLTHEHPFVHLDGKIDIDWYGWLDTLARRIPIGGSTTFTGSTTASVVFKDAGLPNQPDTKYFVVIEPQDGLELWPSNKTTTGFTLNSRPATSATIFWAVFDYR